MVLSGEGVRADPSLNTTCVGGLLLSTHGLIVLVRVTQKCRASLKYPTYSWRNQHLFSVRKICPTVSRLSGFSVQLPTKFTAVLKVSNCRIICNHMIEPVVGFIIHAIIFGIKSVEIYH